MAGRANEPPTSREASAVHNIPFGRRLAQTVLALSLVATAAPVAGAAAPIAARVSPQAGCTDHPVHYRNEIVVLMFHALSPRPSTPFTITPAAFAADLATMRAAGLCPVNLASLAAFLSDKRPVPANAVLLTFDDGLESVFRYAYPIVRRDHVPIAVFLIGSRVGHSHQTLTWSQIHTMALSGLVTFGGHTYALHHSIVTGADTSGPAAAERVWTRGRRETWTQYTRRVRRDAATEQALLVRHLGAPSPYFAFPFGAYNPRLIAALSASGFRFSFTTLPGAVRRGEPPERLPRIAAGMARASAWQVVASVLYVAQEPLGQGTAAPAAVMPVWPHVAVGQDFADLSRWLDTVVTGHRPRPAGPGAQPGRAPRRTRRAARGPVGGTAPR